VNDYLWTLPIVGALVGWATNWVAVRMLFRPREPVRVFGITFHGLIPRRRKDIACSIASTVERELIRPEDVAKLLNDPALAETVKQEIDRRAREFLKKKVDELPTIAIAILPADLEDRLRRSIVKHTMAALPEITQRLAGELSERIDVCKLVEDRINSFDIVKLETVVLEIASRELRMIEILGGFIGALVGGIQWALLYFLPRL
jgi:uncharacterized membrane protein YheB (UPF0754 family)